MKRSLAYIMLVAICFYLVIGTGRGDLYNGGGIRLYLNVAYLFFTAVLCLNFKYIFWIIFFPFFLFLCVYAPVGLIYGEITKSFIMAMFATYTNEALEFTGILRLDTILFSIFCLFYIVFLWRFIPKYKFSKKQAYILFGILILLTITGRSWGVATTSAYAKAIRFFNHSINDLGYYKKAKIEPAWQISEIKPKYKNYVVIIGESARRDYHALYGYKVANTPFLSSVNGVFVDGFMAVGLNTIPALKGTLNHEKDTNLNIIDLAKMAGFETFWLSNQGAFGEYNDATTFVAKQADIKYFTQGRDRYDKELIPIFKEYLNKNSDKNRVFFLHFYGSHPISCYRLSNKDYEKYSDKYTFILNCYVESIRQTDNDISEIYKVLNERYKSHNDSFSLIYFSDHGLIHTGSTQQIQVAHGGKNASKEAIEIPLVKISSDDTNRTFIKNESYQNYFPQSFAKWLGIKAKNFNEYSDIFENVRQKDSLNAKSLIKNKNGDPAIDISKFK